MFFSSTSCIYPFLFFFWIMIEIYFDYFLMFFFLKSFYYVIILYKWVKWIIVQEKWKSKDGWVWCLFLCNMVRWQLNCCLYVFLKNINWFFRFLSFVVFINFIRFDLFYTWMNITRYRSKWKKKLKTNWVVEYIWSERTMVLKKKKKK